MGWLEQYVDYAKDTTDAPIEFHRFVGLGVLSAALGNQVYFRFGDLNIYPNLWVILLAPSSAFRKSTAIGIGKRVLSHACPEVILPNEFTQEKLLQVLQQQPQGIFILYEFMTLSGLLEKDYMSGTKAFLTEIFDNPPVYTRKTMSNNIEIQKPCVSVLAATTTDWFLERAKEGDLYGGFLPRFVYVPALKKDTMLPFPKPADESLRNQLVKRLHDLRGVRGEVDFTRAKQTYEEWFNDFEWRNAAGNPDAPMLKAFHTRLETYALKFAVLLEVSRTASLEVSEETMREACGLVDWLTQRLSVLAEEEFAFNHGERNRKKVLKAIRQRRGISRRDLLRTTHLSAKELNQVIATLKEEEKVDVKPSREGDSHKPVTRYYSLQKVPKGHKGHSEEPLKVPEGHSPSSELLETVSR